MFLWMRSLYETLTHNGKHTPVGPSVRPRLYFRNNCIDFY